MDEERRRRIEADLLEMLQAGMQPPGPAADMGPGAAEAAARPLPDQPERPAERQQPERQQPRNNRPARQAGFQAPQVPVITPAVQASVLQGAIDKTTDAIADENKSRVSQLREMRRMQHEKELEMIRAQAALERVRQARAAQQYSGEAMGNIFDDGRLIDMTGTARRVG